MQDRPHQDKTGKDAPRLNPENPPDFAVTRWFNTKTPISRDSLKGKVVLVHAFQMLCPSCVAHGLPQAQKIRQRFAEDQLAVIGLHTVFEHHKVMTAEALEAFIKEYRFSFPIGMDEPQGAGAPKTMQAYEMQGTPTFLLFDRKGRLRRHYFGRPDDMLLAAEIMALVIEPKAAKKEESIAIERILAATLLVPGHDHGHEHGHGHHHHDHADGCCGHDHDHGSCGG